MKNKEKEKIRKSECCDMNHQLIRNRNKKVLKEKIKRKESQHGDKRKETEGERKREEEKMSIVITESVSIVPIKLNLRVENNCK